MAGRTPGQLLCEGGIRTRHVHNGGGAKTSNEYADEGTTCAGRPTATGIKDGGTRRESDLVEGGTVVGGAGEEAGSGSQRSP